MPAQTTEDDNYQVFSIDLATNVVSNGMWLCIAQLPARTKNDIASNVSCQRNIDVLRELLASADGQPCPLLKRDAQPGQLPLLVCPEYAFGSDDWLRIDGLVDAFPGPLLLVAGFGQTPLEGIESICAGASNRGVPLSKGWVDEPSRGGRAMNFGCVWIKKHDCSREAILFGKNFLEAASEDSNGIFQFKQLTEIVLNDLRLFPFICADVLETPSPGGDLTVSQRLTRMIIGDRKPSLCIGSLLQPHGQASHKWDVGINRLVEGCGTSDAVFIICNVASDRFDPRSGGRLWRNLSGIYVSKRKRAKGQKQAQEANSFFESAALMAWPLRSTLPHLVFGTVNVPPYANDSGKLHPWNTFAKPRRTICCDDTPHVHAYQRSWLQDEILLLSEVTEKTIGGPPLELKHVGGYVRAHPPEFANSLASRLIDGPLLVPPRALDCSDLCDKCVESLEECLICLDTLMEGSEHVASADEKFAWAPASSSDGGVVRLGSTQIPVALWYAVNDTTAQMLTELRRRANTRTGAALWVFGKGRDGDVAPELWKSICIETTTATSSLVASGETGDSYADLPTDEAVPIDRMIKPSGFQPLVRLVLERCANPMDFMSKYEGLVGSLRS